MELIAPYDWQTDRVELIIELRLPAITEDYALQVDRNESLISLQPLCLPFSTSLLVSSFRIS